MFRDKCAITIRKKQYKNDKGREEKKQQEQQTIALVS
jgi:hypothetical protein